MWGRQLDVILELYTGKGVAPEVNLREFRSISHTPPPSVNKAEPTLALKSRGDVTRSSKQGYLWSNEWTRVQQKCKIKRWIPSLHTFLPVYYEYLRFISGATPADRLTVSMVALLS